MKRRTWVPLGAYGRILGPFWAHALCQRIQTQHGTLKLEIEPNRLRTGIAPFIAYILYRGLMHMGKLLLCSLCGLKLFSCIAEEAQLVDL